MPIVMKNRPLIAPYRDHSTIQMTENLTEMATPFCHFTAYQKSCIVTIGTANTAFIFVSYGVLLKSTTIVLVFAGSSFRVPQIFNYFSLLAIVSVATTTLTIALGGAFWLSNLASWRRNNLGKTVVIKGKTELVSYSTSPRGIKIKRLKFLIFAYTAVYAFIAGTAIKNLIVSAKAINHLVNAAESRKFSKKIELLPCTETESISQSLKSLSLQKMERPASLQKMEKLAPLRKMERPGSSGARKLAAQKLLNSTLEKEKEELIKNSIPLIKVPKIRI